MHVSFKILCVSCLPQFLAENRTCVYTKGKYFACPEFAILIRTMSRHLLLPKTLLCCIICPKRERIRVAQQIALCTRHRRLKAYFAYTFRASIFHQLMMLFSAVCRAKILNCYINSLRFCLRGRIRVHPFHSGIFEFKGCNVQG